MGIFFIVQVLGQDRQSLSGVDDFVRQWENDFDCSKLATSKNISLLTCVQNLCITIHLQLAFWNEEPPIIMASVELGLKY